MLIFAYGSNMCDAKLQGVVASAKAVAVCRLGGHALRFHKPSSVDGSGKADAFATGDANDEIWGVVFRIDPSEREALDGAEGLGRGYDLKEVRVVSAGGDEFDALAYVASVFDAQLRPFGWYKRYVVEGARKHALPASYVAMIEAVEAMSDPNPSRAAKHEAVVC